MAQISSETGFMEGFNVMVEEVDKKVESALIEAVSIAYDTLVDQSPIWSGSYILSHRISIDDALVAPPIDIKKSDLDKGGIYPLKVDPLTASSYRKKAQDEKKVLRSAKNFSRIEIGNDTEYAPTVEAISQAPYGQARLVMEAVIKTISNKISS